MTGNPIDPETPARNAVVLAMVILGGASFWIGLAIAVGLWLAG